jgi:hypothetical protein
MLRCDDPEAPEKLCFDTLAEDGLDTIIEMM